METSKPQSPPSPLPQKSPQFNLKAKLSPLFSNIHGFIKKVPTLPLPQKIAIIIGAVLIGLIFIGSLYKTIFNPAGRQPRYSTPTSFEECVLIPTSRILETYPETCLAPNGQKFTKQYNQPQATPVSNSEFPFNLNLAYYHHQVTDIFYSISYPDFLHPQLEGWKNDSFIGKYYQVIINDPNADPTIDPISITINAFEKPKDPNGKPLTETTLTTIFDFMGINPEATTIVTKFGYKATFHQSTLTEEKTGKVIGNQITYAILKDGKLITIAGSTHNQDKINFNQLNQIIDTFKFLPNHCGPCPTFTPPEDNWCLNGTLVYEDPDECNCPSAPTCQ